jgi:hypothetical protein
MSDNQWPRWIPLHEARPPEGEYVLAWWNKHGRSTAGVARRSSDMQGGWWYLKNGIESVAPTHWQPLPEPPRGTP